jgi:hypothetical protein
MSLNGLIALMILLGGHVDPQGQTKQDRPPTAAVVLDRYVEVTGGRTAYSRLHNIYSKGSFVVVGTGIRGTLTSFEAEPGKSLSILEIPGGERVQEGTNGNVAWTSSSRSGARLKENEEKAVALREATFNAKVHWRRLYPQADCVGTEVVNGHRCYKIELKPAGSPPVTHYYDAQSFLLIKSVIPIMSPQGEILSENFYSDYREVSGVLFPHGLNHRVGKEEIVLVIDTIECNTDIPWSRFNPPEEVQDLLRKRADRH